MAGVKGRSGGPRPNSGGARPGAGRKPKALTAPADVASQIVLNRPAVNRNEDALAFLHAVMRGELVPTVAQLDAAKAAVRYTHAPPAAGKKEDAAQRAKKTAAGRFASAATPLKLVKVA